MEFIQMLETQCGIFQPLMSEALNYPPYEKSIYIAYVSREHLDFVPTSTSFVNLNPFVHRLDLESWSYLSYRLSDYPYIYFEVITGKPVPYKANGTNPPLPKLSSIKQVLLNELFLEDFKQ